MSRPIAGPEIERLIQILAKLPGLGPRSARRAALAMINKKQTVMEPLAQALQDALRHVKVCDTCGNIIVYYITLKRRLKTNIVFTLIMKNVICVWDPIRGSVERIAQ